MLEQALRETARVQDGRIPLLGRHLYRLQVGGCDVATLERAKDAALRAAHEWPEPYGRLTIVVSIDGEVTAEVDDRPSTIAIDGGPVIVPVASSTPPLPPGAAKPADRSFWDEALHKAQAEGGDVALLVDDEGRIMDGSQATVWFVFGELLVTPPSPPALAGVSRWLVLDMAPEWGYATEIREVYEQDIELADEIILTTAVAGAVGAHGHPGFAAARLAAGFERIFSTASTASHDATA
jgi:branched-subunit amino acid aminotransferase/4-amino-4-deoxychorismate lyase